LQFRFVKTFWFRELLFRHFFGLLQSNLLQFWLALTSSGSKLDDRLGEVNFGSLTIVLRAKAAKLNDRLLQFRLSRYFSNLRETL